MAYWHNIIKKNPAKIIEFIDHFEKELDQARIDVKIKGSLEKVAAELPGIFEQRFGQLQEVESTLQMLDVKLKKLRSEKFKMFLEKYQRALSSSDAWKYVDGVTEVADMCDLINEVAYVRNQFLGITKALEQKSFMLGHVVGLRKVGIEDATL